MKQRYWRQILFCISLMLAIYVFMPTSPVFAQDSKTGQSNSQLGFQSPEKIGSHVAGMTDEQVRQAYDQKLKQDAEKQSASENGRPPDKIVDSFYGAAKAAATVLKRVGSIFGGGDRSDVQWADVVAKLSAGKGAAYLFGTILGLAVIIALGLVLRWLFHRRHPAKLNQCRTTGKISFFRKGPFTHTAGCNGHRCLCPDNVYSFCNDLPGGKTEL